MEYKSKSSSGITPRLIIHGGAGNILPSNLPPARYQAFHHSLLSILSNTHYYLQQGHDAVDTVTYAVTQLENNPLFNAGHGAVFTREGINECEASIMCSRGYKKRGVGVMGLRHVKNPIKLAREMLIRGEDDIEGGNGVRRGKSIDEMNVARGAQGHSQLHKFSAEKLAAEWGLEMVEPSYFFTETRWQEHLNGLDKEKKGTGQASWDAQEFISQGTTGAVALDADGICAAATSTGGMTNKLTGRIGDTPTLGAGFWAEEWEDEHPSKEETMLRQPGPGLVLSETLKGLMADCLPSLTMYSPVPAFEGDSFTFQTGYKVIRATAMSGTGNGDSFLRINAARTASAIARFKGSSLQKGITNITGPGGELEKSAGNRWKKTGEGEGGIIGVECTVVLAPNGEKKMATSHIVDDFNCGGMFRAAVDKHGKAVMRVWRPGQYDDLEGYEGEGKQYDVREWLDEKMLL